MSKIVNVTVSRLPERVTPNDIELWAMATEVGILQAVYLSRECYEAFCACFPGGTSSLMRNNATIIWHSAPDGSIKVAIDTTLGPDEEGEHDVRLEYLQTAHALKRNPIGRMQIASIAKLAWNATVQYAKLQGTELEAWDAYAPHRQQCIDLVQHQWNWLEDPIIAKPYDVADLRHFADSPFLQAVFAGLARQLVHFETLAKQDDLQALYSEV